jgi:mono/diheme cytochrome c family protein
MGRIWRITTAGAPKATRPDLARATASRLVELLASPDAWWRDTAQRLLVERQDAAVVPSLKRVARQSPTSVARLHALWTLDGLHAVDWDTVQAALDDADVDVATVGARLAESHLDSDTARAVRAIDARARWGEPAFLRQAALSLGAGPPEAVQESLMRLATRHGSLPFMADAIVSSLAGRESPALARLATAGPEARPVVASLGAAILHGGDASAIDELFSWLQRADIRPEFRDALLDGVDRFIPGEGERRRTAFLPHEPAGFVAFSRGAAPGAERARTQLRFLRWRGQQVDEATSLAALSAAERTRYERGRQEFALCASCHQPHGEGMSGLAPPLVGSPWATGNPAATVRIVLQGKTSGATTMPPLAALDDEKIAAILTFVRRSWGHESSPVTAAQVQAVRSETRLRQEPWTETELAALD